MYELLGTDSITVGFEGWWKRLEMFSESFGLLEAFFSFEILKMNKTSGPFFIKNVQAASLVEFQVC